MIHEKLIETITTSICYSKFKVNNKNVITACAFWACYCLCQLPSEIGQKPKMTTLTIRDFNLSYSLKYHIKVWIS